MSSMVIPRVGLIRMLDDINNDTLTLRLYSNNHTPAAGDTSADYTEVSGGGYVSITLNGANWTEVAASPSTSTYNSVQTFTFTGATSSPSTVYGYYVTRGSGEVVWAERLVTNPFVPINGTYVKVTPKLTLNSNF